MPAPATQENPTQYGNVFRRTERMPAGGTVRRFPDDAGRLLVGFVDRQFKQLAALLSPTVHQAHWQPQDDDIEKAADDKADDSRERCRCARFQEKFDHRNARRR